MRYCSRLVSVLFSEPKIPQCIIIQRIACSSVVSVLFSEPKIPQSPSHIISSRPNRRGFSALQRAENSSIPRYPQPFCYAPNVSVLFSEPKIPQSSELPKTSKKNKQQFQCSSASRKFLNNRRQPATSQVRRFQCSSASRKFLN